MANPYILLFGMPRSGTTWLGKIFDSHPDVLYRHEPDSWRKLQDVPLYPEVDDAGQYCAYLRTYSLAVAEIAAPEVTSKLPLFNKNFSSRVRSVLHRASVYCSLAVGKLSPKIKLPTLYPVSAPKAGSMHVVWKSIESLGRLGLLTRCIENSRSIHLIRHPCGYISSVLQGEEGKVFESSVRASEDYGILTALIQSRSAQKYGLTEDELRSLSAEERLAWRWLLINEKTLHDLDGQERSLIVRYEDICEAPVAQARRLFEFTGLQWSDQTQRFVESSVTHASNSYYSVFKDPKISATKWRQHLTLEQKERIARVVKRSEALSTLYADLF